MVPLGKKDTHIMGVYIYTHMGAELVSMVIGTMPKVEPILTLSGATRPLLQKGS